MSYPKPLPVDQNRTPLQENPAAVLAQQTFQKSGEASSVITFNDNVTQIEVAAIGGAGVAIKWIPTSDTQASVIGSGLGANFTHIVPANTVRKFVVPKETTGTASLVGVNIKEGLYRRVAVVSASAPHSSVATATY